MDAVRIYFTVVMKSFAIEPGIFVPVSQDDKGIYYQAVNGYRTIRGNARIAGGLYVSKARSGAIWAYGGVAKNGSNAGVEKRQAAVASSRSAPFADWQSRDEKVRVSVRTPRHGQATVAPPSAYNVRRWTLDVQRCAQHPSP